MTIFQRVRLSISSSVIMFHRERKECGPENGKNGGRSRNNAPKPESGKKGEAYGQPQPIEEKRQGRHGKRRQTARTARKRQRKTVICRVGSERSPCPRLRYPLMGQEEDFIWKTPGGVTHWDIITRQNIPRQIFSLTLYYAS